MIANRIAIIFRAKLTGAVSTRKYAVITLDLEYERRGERGSDFGFAAGSIPRRHRLSARVQSIQIGHSCRVGPHAHRVFIGDSGAFGGKNQSVRGNSRNSTMPPPSR
jgi:hypothetical protein